ncbi:MAG: AIR synthase related protein [Deltaproteobacteria bacterium]|nr:AIR synthase related protein [Deltaproteobacteria bacterium]
MNERKLTYGASGVDYSRIDPLKLMAQAAARDTAPNLRAAGYAEIEESRGESAYVIDMGDFLLAAITECLGTKALVADAMRALSGRSHYDSIAQDTIAMAVNDLVTVGARPLAVHAYWAAGGSSWFDDEERMADLVRGWKAACNASGVSWGGGETPSLSGVVCEGAMDLAASCVGVVRPKERLTLGERLRAGDAIVILASGGIHANGITLARKLAERLPQGYATRIGDGRMYGEALLDPTVLYPKVTEALFAAGVEIRYMSNITGHGWRKLMRHPAALTYRVTRLPPVPPVLEFLAREAGLDAREAYGSLNMGAGFAVFVPQAQAALAVETSEREGVRAFHAGRVEAGDKRVIIEPLGVTFEGESLAVRL